MREGVPGARSGTYVKMWRWCMLLRNSRQGRGRQECKEVNMEKGLSRGEQEGDGDQEGSAPQASHLLKGLR